MQNSGFAFPARFPRNGSKGLLHGYIGRDGCRKDRLHGGKCGTIADGRVWKLKRQSTVQRKCYYRVIDLADKPT